MISRHTIHGITAALSMLAVLSASADATLDVLGPDGLKSTIQVRNDKGRISNNRSSDYLLYDNGTGLITYVEPQQQQYTQLSTAELKTMVQTAASIKQTVAPYMTGMLAGLPEEQRKMIEQRMGVLMDAPAAGEPSTPAAVRIVKQGMATIAGLRCQNNTILKDDQPAVEACMATAASGNLSDPDFSTLVALVKFSRSMAGSASSLLGGVAAQYQLLTADLEGVPVTVRDIRQNRLVRITAVSNNALTDEIFGGYETFEKQSMQNLFR